MISFFLGKKMMNFFVQEKKINKSLYVWYYYCGKRVISDSDCSYFFGHVVSGSGSNCNQRPKINNNSYKKVIVMIQFAHSPKHHQVKTRIISNIIICYKSCHLVAFFSSKILQKDGTNRTAPYNAFIITV